LLKSYFFHDVPGALFPPLLQPRSDISEKGFNLVLNARDELLDFVEQRTPFLSTSSTGTRAYGDPGLSCPGAAARGATPEGTCYCIFVFFGNHVMSMKKFSYQKEIEDFRRAKSLLIPFKSTANFSKTFNPA
jgi:hypothetical protein